MEKLNEDKIQTLLAGLKEWHYVDNAIEKKFVFPNFIKALGFIVQVGVNAEKRNHHPELINVYNKVTIRLNTHDADGITQKDFDLAKDIDAIE